MSQITDHPAEAYEFLRRLDELDTDPEFLEQLVKPQRDGEASLEPPRVSRWERRWEAYCRAQGWVEDERIDHPAGPVRTGVSILTDLGELALDLWRQRTADSRVSAPRAGPVERQAPVSADLLEQVLAELTSRQQAIMKHLWARGRARIDALKTVPAAFAPGGVDDDAVRRQIKEINKRLASKGIPVSLSRSGEMVRLDRPGG
jgi:hypothetical protein